jgi:hypothetical protein
MSRASLVLRGILREPTVHFVLLAGVLFALNAHLQARDRGDVIEIDRGEIEERIADIEAASGSTLSVEERQQVVDSYIDEQVLVREALALGLEDDARIHDFLAQKMLHVLSADVIQPADADLERYFAANRERYAAEQTVSVHEVVVAASEALPHRLREQLDEGVAAEDLVSDVPIRHALLSDVTRESLMRIFGPDIANRVFGAQPGDLIGPHRSVRGQHWIRVISHTEALTPPLDSIRAQVRLDWIVEQEEVRLERRVDELRDRYSIVFTPEGAR